jgi:hypothetical protein
VEHPLKLGESMGSYRSRLLFSGLANCCPGEARVSLYRWLKAVITIVNNFGPITVGPSGNKQVLVTSLAYSDSLGFTNEQHGTRLNLETRSKHPGGNLASYKMLVPDEAIVIMRSLAGKLHVEKIRGDVVVQGFDGAIEITGISDAHVHIQNIAGAITLAGISNSHVDVQTVSGNVTFHGVTASTVRAHSGAGVITYEGNPEEGEYDLSTHSGDLVISVPADAAIQIKAFSLKGHFNDKTSGETSALGRRNGNSLRTSAVYTSRFVLRSFTGSIRLERPSASGDLERGRKK